MSFYLPQHGQALGIKFQKGHESKERILSQVVRTREMGKMGAVYSVQKGA